MSRNSQNPGNVAKQILEAQSQLQGCTGILHDCGNPVSAALQGRKSSSDLGRAEPWVSCKSPGAYISNQTQEWAWTCRQCEFLSQQLREGRRPLPEPPQKMLQTLIPVKEAGDSEKDSICILIKICLRVSLAVRTVSIPIGFYVVQITRNWQGHPCGRTTWEPDQAWDYE